MALVKRVGTVKCAPGMVGFCFAVKRLPGIAFVTGLIITLSAPDGLAAPIAIANPGFESDPAPVPSDITAGVPTGWAAHNPNSIPSVFFGSLFAARPTITLVARQKETMLALTLFQLIDRPAKSLGCFKHCLRP